MSNSERRIRHASREPKKPQTAFRLSLGPLEAQVMTILWSCGECNVRQVQEKLSTAAYTTVMTTMSRLYQKGLLERRKQQSSFTYSAISPVQWGVLAASEFIGHFISVTNTSPDLVKSSISKAISMRQRKLAGKNPR